MAQAGRFDSGPLPCSTVTKRKGTMKAKVVKIEARRLADEAATLERGEPCIGIQAVARVQIKELRTIAPGSALLQEIVSGGIWGVEVNGSPQHKASLELEERTQLKEILEGLRIDLGEWGEGGADDQRCPSCGSPSICQQTPSDTRQPWGCLACDAEFETPTK